jgi:RND superfamily putative drug exporter
MSALASFVVARRAIIVVAALLMLVAAGVWGGSVTERPIVQPTTSYWTRIARLAMGRPLLVGGAVLAVLLVVASPIRRLEFGLNDDRVLPASVESRQVNDRIRSEYSGLEGGAISVVFAGAPSSGFDPGVVDGYARALADLDGVTRVDTVTGPGDEGTVALMVIPSVEPISSEGQELVEQIRSIDGPGPVVVGGEAARLVDNTDHVLGRLPFVLVGMLIVNGTLLAALFRSVLAPLKALALNVLSLSAMYGAIVWVFQDGRLTGLMGYTPTGLTDVTVPTLMFAVAFGLSMDYEVYLMARMRESYLATGDPVASTVDGLERTGRILTASALLMAVVFTSFATGSVTHLKILGIGITLAVLADAFLVRTLVPAFMAIAGSANWWPGARPARLVDPVPVDRDDDVGQSALIPERIEHHTHESEMGVGRGSRLN